MTYSTHRRAPAYGTCVCASERARAPIHDGIPRAPLLGKNGRSLAPLRLRRFRRRAGLLFGRVGSRVFAYGVRGKLSALPAQWHAGRSAARAPCSLRVYTYTHDARAPRWLRGGGKGATAPEALQARLNRVLPATRASKVRLHFTSSNSNSVFLSFSFFGASFFCFSRGRSHFCSSLVQCRPPLFTILPHAVIPADESPELRNERLTAPVRDASGHALSVALSESCRHS